MTTASRQLRQILAAQGFADPDAWLAYAAQHGLRQTAASRLVDCPDCGFSEARRLGQFVYYSQLVLLLECRRCGLVYTDTRLDPAVTNEHFEHAYKDDAYFAHQRRATGLVPEPSPGSLGRPSLATAEKGERLYRMIRDRIATRVLGVAAA